MKFATKTHKIMPKILALAFSSALFLGAQTPEAPSYVLASGISYDALARQSSTVSTLGLKIGDLKGLPTYQLTTIETSLAAAQSVAILRAGIAQTVFEKGNVSLGICTDAGVVKSADVSTLGTLTGCGWLSWDVGARFTGGKTHVFLIPTFRLVAVSGVQVKPSYALRVGTGF